LSLVLEATVQNNLDERRKLLERFVHETLITEAGKIVKIGVEEKSLDNNAILNKLLWATFHET